jgi:hypothetical protein
VDQFEKSSSDIQTELRRRQKAAALTVRALIVLIIVLSLVAFIGRSHFRHQENPLLDIALRITILIFGLGSVVLRRTRFSAMRLQDIAALKGVSGLLGTLERTTIQVAILGIVIAIFGFIVTLRTGNDFYTYGSGLVGLVVLLYCYPTLFSWQRTVERFAPTAAERPPTPTFQATE